MYEAGNIWGAASNNMVENSAECILKSDRLTNGHLRGPASSRTMIVIQNFTATRLRQGMRSTNDRLESVRPMLNGRLTQFLGVL